MNKKKVLVTGASGRVGQVALSSLADRYDLSALNRGHLAGVPCTQADIAELDAITPAFEGIDAVLHLAASTMAGNWESLLATNIVGVRNVYEAAPHPGREARGERQQRRHDPRLRSRFHLTGRC